jgi:hypothetical protein
LAVLDDNVRSPLEAVQAAAVRALHAYSRAYCAAPGAAARLARLAAQYNGGLHGPHVAARRGSALALGALPAEVLRPELGAVVLALCTATLPEEDPEQRDVESRANAVVALGRVCQEVWGAGLPGAAQAGGSSGGCGSSGSDGGGAAAGAGGAAAPVALVLQRVVPALMAALQDYSTDNRGDVGSWVREAALKVRALRCAVRQGPGARLQGPPPPPPARASAEPLQPPGPPCTSHTQPLRRRQQLHRRP